MMKYISVITAFLLLSFQCWAQTYTLEDCVNMALENNARIKSGNIDVQVSEQTKKQAFTSYFPKISAMGLGLKSSEGMIQSDIDLSMVGALLSQLGMDPSALGIPSSISINTLDKMGIGMVTAMQPVFAGGQIVNGNRLSRLGKDVAELQLKLSTNEVVANTQQYFNQYIALSEKLTVLDASGKLLGEIYNSVKSASDAGVALNTDVYKVEIQLQTIESNKLKVSNGMTIMKLLLAQYIGAENADFELSGNDFYGAEPPSTFYIPSEQAVDSRAEASLLDKSVEAATLQRKMTVGKYLPTVAVGGAYNYMSMMDKGYDFFLGMATVSVPISGWWGGAHNIKGMKLKEEKAAIERDEKKGLLIVDIESKWNTLNEAYMQIDVAGRKVVSAEAQLTLSRNHYDAGVMLLKDLLDAEREYEQARSELIDANVAYHNAIVSYKQATGR